MPDLSVVVPARNEAEALPSLLRDLASQEGPALEVVVADGGSDDATREVAAGWRTRGFPVRVVKSPAGRGRQMNAGAGAARASDLLFLHADTSLDDPGLLARARESLEAERSRRGHFRVAGHFGLRFRRSRPGRGGAYYFYEAKTLLGRPGCINGDQGLWLSRAYFDELGGFDESLPYLEDIRLARRIFATGAWVTLPGRLGTSARRFETEGLGARQTLNALLKNFDDIGLSGFFEEAAQAYRDQAGAGPLALGPLLRLAHRASCARGWRRFLRYWWDTGGYVAANAWQLAFALDCRRNRCAGHPPGEGPARWLARYDRWGAPVVTSAPGRLAATLVTAGWFFCAMLRGQRP